MKNELNFLNAATQLLYQLAVQGSVPAPSRVVNKKFSSTLLIAFLSIVKMKPRQKCKILTIFFNFVSSTLTYYTLYI